MIDVCIIIAVLAETVYRYLQADIFIPPAIMELMTTLTLNQALQQAIAHHQAREFPQAEHLYRAILQVESNHADANHNLGVLALNVNKPLESLAFFKTALESNPQQRQFWLSYIEALMQVEQFELARAVLQQGQSFGLDGKEVMQLAQRLVAPSSAELEALANAFNQGNYAHTETLARDLIARFPQHSIAWKALGVILQHQGQLEEALKISQHALVLSPFDAENFYNLGNIFNELGELEQAKTHYLQAITLKPTDADMHNNLAITLHELGQFEAAIAHYQQAINLKSDHAEAYLNLSSSLKALARLDEAKRCCQQALAIKPDYDQAYNNLGIIFAELGDLAASEQNYRQALLINPEYVAARDNLGITLKKLGRFKEAERCHRYVIQLQPDYVEAYNNLGIVFRELGILREAEYCYRQAIEIKPDYAEAYINLGVTLQAAQRLQDAEACYRQALTLQADTVEAHVNLGNVLKDQGRFAEAEQSYLTSLKLKPTLTTAIANLLFLYNYLQDKPSAQCLIQAKRYGTLATQKVRQKFTHWGCEPSPKKLRVGVVSGDLREHVVSHFLENFLPYLDRSRIELIAYSNYAKTDAVSERLKSYFFDWKIIYSLSDEAAATLIHADGVHILMDLAGHTAHNRLLMFAWKPAPLQISWLGYWATTGLAEMDYLLADKVGVPEQNQWHFTEKIYYLPDTRLCFSAPQSELDVAELPALSTGYITLGCFQNLSKVTDRVLAVWGKILAQLPDARLRFQCKQLRDKQVAETFYARLVNCGIDATRVKLHAATSRAVYLHAHGQVDMILDTFPYTGGTTTCEALWMGVPTLTLAGETLLARQGASLLAAAGLPEWIVDSEEAYVTQAVVFAKDLTYLATLRRSLREQVLASPLFNGQRFAHNFENTLWQLWRDNGLNK